MAVRAIESFNIQTSDGIHQGIGWKNCRLLQWADGYGYSATSKKGGAETPCLKAVVSAPSILMIEPAGYVENATIRITGKISPDKLAVIAKALSVGLVKFGISEDYILKGLKKSIQDRDAYVLNLIGEDRDGFTYVFDHELLRVCEDAKIVFSTIDNGLNADETAPYKIQVQLDNGMTARLIEAPDKSLSVSVTSLPGPESYAEWAQAMLRMQVNDKLTLLPTPALRPKP